ncbi:MAG: nicotinamide-nucleotide adenylyltransferase [Nitrososphaeria archaeon]|nr:nicotinamide-nucleotide adenylyltransferase [Nitrososphaeria archaeon]NIQ33039.1 nicotinamide-nucleotide adenylyltransferase [Nitrososphaeria archaeon]
MSRGIFVGRFNPFHKGHLKAIMKILKEVGELIIVVGSSEKDYEVENPFTTGERIMMIRAALDEADVEASRYFIIPVPDIHSHKTWVMHIIAYVPPFDVVYSNNVIVTEPFKDMGFAVKPVLLFERELFSATEVRKRMLEDGNWEELVPGAIAEYIKRIKGVERIHRLSETDRV